MTALQFVVLKIYINYLPYFKSRNVMLEFISLSLKKPVFILSPLVPDIKHYKKNPRQTQIISNRMWFIGAVVINVLYTKISWSYKDCLVLYMRSFMCSIFIKVKVHC